MSVGVGREEVPGDASMKGMFFKSIIYLTWKLSYGVLTPYILHISTVYHLVGLYGKMCKYRNQFEIKRFKSYFTNGRICLL